ncbi:MAG: VanW family protein [Armatimonadota bacterium]|nr:MAG: VanW family protein [Armatimonadota bacterium]
MLIRRALAPLSLLGTALRRRLRVVGVVIAAAALLVAGLAVATRDRGRVYPHVSVAGHDLGGLERSAARDALAKAPLPRGDTPLSVRIGASTHRCRLRDTGAAFSTDLAVEQAYAVGRTGSALQRLRERARSYWQRTDVPVPVVVDDEAARAFVKRCARRFNRSPTDASVETNSGQVRVTPGEPGLTVEADGGLQAVEEWARGGCKRDLRLPVWFMGPAITADRLKAIDTVLASVRTSVAGSSRDRRHNVALSAAAVDGCILMPGASFSYNEVVGPRTEQTGYRTAPVIRRGKLVPGTGGGACQLSSTLYQAALLAGLEIVARSHHSRPVPYTRAGLDATVVYGAIDLKFRNCLEHPVVLRAGIEDRRLKCEVLGHGPPPEMEFVRRVRWLEPPPPQVIEDPMLAVGERVVEVEPRRGITVQVLRRAGGAEAAAAEPISTDYYAAERAVIRQGTGTGPSPPMPGATDAERPESGPEAGEPAGEGPGVHLGESPAEASDSDADRPAVRKRESDTHEVDFLRKLPYNQSNPGGARKPRDIRRVNPLSRVLSHLEN